tara:strand:- start:58 stop:1068 length:1011 start_codon:yes stop_codon:yes gene_type:complete
MNRTFIIAEIGVNHNNNMALAKKMISAAKKAGADAVKFQTFNTEEFVTRKTPKVKYQKKYTNPKSSHFDMIKSLELSKSNHKVIKNFCVKKKINFLSTPYDINSAKFLKKLGCRIFKTASADIVDLELHAYLAKTKKKVLISTGMSNLEEINQCVKIYKKYSNNKYVLLHCVSNYPCSFKSLNLKAISLIKERFKSKVGYSDHSNGYLAAVTSVVLGASVVEKHFTINRGLPGPDQKASSTPNEFSKMVREIRKTELILGKKIKKCQKEELQMSRVSRKSLTLIKNIKKKQVLKRNYLKLKRPGTGIYFNKINKLLGKKARKDFKKNYQIREKDFY